MDIPNLGTPDIILNKLGAKLVMPSIKSSAATPPPPVSTIVYAPLQDHPIPDLDVNKDVSDAPVFDAGMASTVSSVGVQEFTSTVNMSDTQHLPGIPMSTIPLVIESILRYVS